VAGVAAEEEVRDWGTEDVLTDFSRSVVPTLAVCTTSAEE